MSRRSALRCKAPGCHTILAWVADGVRLKLIAADMQEFDGEIVLTCPACGVKRVWQVERRAA